MLRPKLLALLAVLLCLFAGGLVQAAKISDVRGTKHNLSASSTYVRNGLTLNVPARNVKASTETEVCIFCHTPHGTQNGPVALWNRDLSGTAYSADNTYTSSSMDANMSEVAAGPGGSSKLCLSCHDGTMGIDKVNVNMTPTGNSATIAMVNGSGAALASPVNMPPGSGEDSGFTRRLGKNLSNDHPISFTYSSSMVDNDGELNLPDADNSTGGIVMNRQPGKEKPVLPLENGKVQCSTCHDPHLRDDADANAKFLRANRHQTETPNGTYRDGKDIICLACHNKGGGSWAYSAHASDQVATHAYQTTTAAALRGFVNPATNTGRKVWEMACLNCHDTHTVQGARRLLREGMTSRATNNATISAGLTGGSITTNNFSGSAIENTCYQCHDGSGWIINASGNASGVPNIKAEFDLAGTKMPISLDGEDAKHNISSSLPANVLFPESVDCGIDKKCGADFMETRVNLNARHAECTDCHNPHRVIKAQNGLPGQLTATNTKDKAGTHRHEDATGYIHSNTISGVLRGAWGVEPDYESKFSFHDMPVKFDVKRGDPGPNTSTLPSATYVTREYQICLKCHSNYGYEDDNKYPNGEKRPLLGGTGLTAKSPGGHFAFERYTNQAKEFQAPSTHAVTVGSVSKGTEAGNTSTTGSPNVDTNTNNHRSWHPVMRPTGRYGRAGAFLAPWNNSGTGGYANRLGYQTMLCSDCHGAATGAATVMPTDNTSTSENGTPWGPHGSTLPFILKGTYSSSSGEGDPNTLCFKCHNQNSYAGSGGGTGFTALRSDGSSRGDGHSVHNDKIDTAMKCNFCHVAVPHGWKNRGLLVNLNDVGPEAGLAPGTRVWTSGMANGGGGYSNGPYYRHAYLRITSFPTNGQWRASSCNGGEGGMLSSCEKPV